VVTTQCPSIEDVDVAAIAFVSSSSEAMTFYWKGNALFTRSKLGDVASISTQQQKGIVKEKKNYSREIRRFCNAIGQGLTGRGQAHEGIVLEHMPTGYLSGDGQFSFGFN